MRVANHKAHGTPRIAHHSASRTATPSDGSVGIASYYHESSRTASGERFSPDGLTAAHRTLPFGTLVRVTNLENNHAVTVRINDRGPFIKNRSIDLSSGAAGAIGMKDSGVAKVRMEVVK